jgi:pimeloyl-ACP methyl ester carboxylesterase
MQQTTSLALVSFSEGVGSPLVMLGGGTLGAGEFAPHARVLASDFRVVRLQTLNVDRAQKKQPLPAGYSLKTESGAMAGSLDQFGLTAPLDIVGHSFGALVALDFALDHPDRVHKLILAEPPAFWVVPLEELRATADMRKMYELVRTFGPTIEPTDDQFVRFLCAVGNCNVKPPARTGAEWEVWVSCRAALRGFSVIADHTDDVNRLKNFRRPVLVMTGSSTISFHRRIDDILATHLPLAESTELPGDHGAPVSVQDEFVSKMRAFLARPH